MQAVSSLPCANISLICFEKSVIMTLRSSPLGIVHVICHSTQGSEKQQKQLLICYLGKPGQNTCSYLFIFWITHLSRCAGLLCLYTKQSFPGINENPVVIVIWSFPILKLRCQVESQKMLQGHGKAEEDIWEAHCISFCSHSNKQL